MADKQISDLTAITTPASGAALAHVKDGANSRKVTLTQMGAAKVLLSAQEVSGVASVNFTSVITSAFDEYELVITELVPATDATDLWLRFSTDNGSSWDSGSNYAWTRNINDTNTTTFSGASSNSDTKIILYAAAGNATGETLVGKWQIANPNSTSLYKIVTGSSGGYHSSAVGRGTFNTGVYKIQTAVNALQLLMSSGNITGKFYLYGIRKS